MYLVELYKGISRFRREQGWLNGWWWLVEWCLGRLRGLGYDEI